MKKVSLLVSLIILVLNVSCRQNTKQVKKDKMDWWKQAKFGMFIHWGIYSVPAGVYKGKDVPYGEWIMDQADIPIDEYEKYSDKFNPTDFNAAEWVNYAKEAGMKYIVITSKHHDGFGLWDSKVSDYDIMDKTPYKKDILKQLAEECKKQDIKLCFYYSIMDWHHPKANKEHFDEYYNEYMKLQLKELVTEYGDLGVLWFDGEWIDEWTDEKGIELYNYLTSIQPNVIINNRIGNGRNGMSGITKESSFAGDYDTPEQEIPSIKLDSRSWETCMTMNDTWGYRKNDHNWKSTEELIFKLTDITAKGGNLLLNIGPKADGKFPEPSVKILKEIGSWLKINSEAIYSTRPYRKFQENNSIRFTESLDSKFLYVIAKYNDTTQIKLSEINITPNSIIEILGYNQEVKYKTDSENLIVEIPKDLPQNLTEQNIITLKIHQKKYIKLPEIKTEKDNDGIKVIIDNNDPSLIIKYTLDGSIPNYESKSFTSPMSFNKPNYLKLNAYKEDFARSVTHTEIIDIPISNVNGISYKYYEGKNWLKLPNFKNIKPLQKGVVQDFDISEIKNSEDQFAIKFKSNIKIPKTGLYKFYINSDDGAKLYIDNQLIIDNDGSHSKTKKEFELELKKGLHKIELDYFDDCEDEFLDLSFSSREIPKQNIPMSFLFIK